MAFPATLQTDESHREHVINGTYLDREARSTSAVSWGAIAAGAAAAAALSLILLMLGVGLGLSSVSPWSHAGLAATTLGVGTIVWLTVTQLLASAMGGYLAGRLRTRWTDAQADEVYFRDTAHGFLAWAVSSLATAALLTSVIGSIVGGGIQAGATAAGGSAVAATAAATGMVQNENAGSMGYHVDRLFRRDTGDGSPATTDTTTMPMPMATNTPDSTTGVGPSGTSGDDAVHAREAAEIGRIFMQHGMARPLAQDDVRHIGQRVAQRTGLSQEDAQKRVTDTYSRAQSGLREAETDARAAADTARKASATTALWLFVSLLVGAFCASLAATFGGRQRDA